MIKIKDLEDSVENYEDFVMEMVGKFVHATKNEHTSQDPLDPKDITVNAWFAGKVAGYEKTVFSYDYRTEEFFDEPQVLHKVLLCDGMAYALSEDTLEINELSEEEFTDMVAEHQAKEDARNSIILD